MNLQIRIAEDFTDTPGARHYSDGPFSGEQFFNEILCPRYELALKTGVKLEIDLDRVWGYPSSFISGSFGRLRDKFGLEEILSNLVFISIDNPNRPREIEKNIREKK